MGKKCEQGVHWGNTGGQYTVEERAGLINVQSNVKYFNYF